MSGNPMRSSLTRKSLSVASVAVLVVAALAALFPPAAHALPPNEIDREYYSDATYTVLVGEWITFCNGQSWRWGITTVYKIVYTFPCFAGGRSTSAGEVCGEVEPFASQLFAGPGEGAPGPAGCAVTTAGLQPAG